MILFCFGIGDNDSVVNRAKPLEPKTKEPSHE